MIRAIALILLVPLLSSCTKLLTEWARETVRPGASLGVIEETDTTTVVAFLYDEQGEVRYSVLRVPSDWRSLPRFEHEEEAGLRVALVDPLVTEPVEGVGESIGKPMKLHPEAVGGHVSIGDDVARDIELASDMPTTLGVIVVDEDVAGEHVPHEIYGYDASEYRWVRLATVDLGFQEGIPGREGWRKALIVPAVAVDAVLFAAAAALFVVGAALSG